MMSVCFRWQRPRRETTNAEDTPAAMFATQSANEWPMYCKNKIYTGGKEYSFDELRAWDWWARQREEQRRQAEINQMKSDIVYVSPPWSINNVPLLFFE